MHIKITSNIILMSIVCFYCELLLADTSSSLLNFSISRFRFRMADIKLALDIQLKNR